MFLEDNKLVIIAFVPRSGSNYLCDMLLRAGGLTTPLEYYFPYDFAERVAEWDTKESTLERIDKDTITNKVSWFMEVLSRGGLKCTWTAHEKMIEEIGEFLDKIDTRYIYLRRIDKLRQAISWYRANVSKRWTSQDERQHPDPPYSREEIDKRLEYIRLDEERWGEFLKDKEHLELFYEGLNYDVLNQYEEFTGLRRNRVRDLDSEYTIIRDDLTEEWVEKYNARSCDK